MTAARSTHTFNLPLLDTLRAIGAVGVLTTHVAFWSGNYMAHSTIGPILARLDVGVALFFVLSGFLLGRPWIARAAEGQPAPSSRVYLWKRFWRIVPLYLVTVTLALAFIEVNRGFGVRDWIVTLLGINTFVDVSPPAGLTHMWSLAVEVTFYLVLPLLMLALVGRRRLSTRRFLIGLGAMVVTAGVWILVVVPWLDPKLVGQPGQWLPAYLTWFAAGLLLAWVHVRSVRPDPPAIVARLVALAAHPGSCWLIAIGLLVAISTPIGGPTSLEPATTTEGLTKHLVYTVIGFVLVLTAVFPRSDGLYTRTLSHPVSRRLGWISYGIFCFNLPVLHFVYWLTGWPTFEGRGLEIWVLTMAGTILAAEIAYRLIERPSLAMKDRMPRWMRPGAAREADAAIATSTGTSAK